MPACGSCVHAGGDREPEQRVGLSVSGRELVVALAGNPNTGKSTVFNFLTGLRQHTGNWPGKTVARAEGVVVHAGTRIRLVDLPGTYSLLADSIDEQVARDFLLFGRPDCTIVVCDATVLERNLGLVLQIIEITPRVVVCLNLMDEAQRRGLRIDADKLVGELGVPVVPTVARHGRGLEELMDRVRDVALGVVDPEPRRTRLGQEIEQAVAELEGRLSAAWPALPCARWIALRLLDGDARVVSAVATGALGQLAVSGGDAGVGAGR